MLDAMTIKIFLSSPSDVQKERDLLKGVVDELDHRYSSNFNVHLELVRWEDVPPGMGDPQKVINEKVGQIGEHDFFVGIMWRRFGTPAEGYDSGTQYEFEQACKAWQQNGRPSILFYFSEEPISISRLTQDEVDQLSKVISFREDLKTRSLVRTFPSSDKFADVVRRDLDDKVMECLKKSGALAGDVKSFAPLKRLPLLRLS